MIRRHGVRSRSDMACPHKVCYENLCRWKGAPPKCEREGAGSSRCISAAQDGVIARCRPPFRCADAGGVFLRRCFCLAGAGSAGGYEIRVGASSRDIRLRETIRREGARVEEPAALRGSWYEHPSGHPGRGWLACGGARRGGGDFTLNNTMVELADYSFLARFMVSMIRRKLAKDLGLSVQEAEQTRSGCLCPERWVGEIRRVARRGEAGEPRQTANLVYKKIKNIKIRTNMTA